MILILIKGYGDLVRMILILTKLHGDLVFLLRAILNNEAVL